MNLTTPFDPLDPNGVGYLDSATFVEDMTRRLTADGYQVFGKPIYDRVPEDP